ncbi:MAG: HD domain-containing protein [Clostridia bacterium]|nr:HD domain-containing protein [Clostridia bacterium]
MFEEKYDFYSPSNIKLTEIDKNLQESLSVMNKLDDMTKQHCLNVSNLSTRICQYMRENNQFTIHCMIAGYVHDVGKMYIPKEILTKPGKLTDEEFEIMKTHTTLGYEYCMNDPNLRPYHDGPWYHHEALNGTGYPRGLRGKNNIPYSAQIIRVADEYDALVTKRHYTTHVNISETLKVLIKDAQPSKPLVALDVLKQNERLGKINPKPLKALFKAVINDIKYEISCVMNYTQYLETQIKRLENIKSYEQKRDASNRPEKKDYYFAGMKMLLQNGETLQNYGTILEEYKKALIVRNKRIDDLYNEIKIVKRLRV